MNVFRACSLQPLGDLGVQGAQGSKFGYSLL